LPYHISLVINFSTAPTNRQVSSSHTGSISEGFWIQNIPSIGFPAYMFAWATFRAPLLASEATVIGWRADNYSIAGNKKLPQGTSSGLLNIPGLTARPLGSPFVALECSTGTAGQNTSRFRVGLLPGLTVQNGEWTPDAQATASLQLYFKFLQAQLGGQNVVPYGFIGRVLSNQSAIVNQITYAAPVPPATYPVATVTLANAIPGAAVGNYLRFRRVYDANDNPVKGSYVIQTINGAVYTINGVSQTVIVPSGTARIDDISFYAISNITAGRVVGKKPGSPGAKYRGRRSKSRI
jgi:hypothetical protein